MLTELGLVPALRTLVRRAPLPVGLEYSTEARCPAPVEAAAYFLAAEALTNVARYAEATRADVRVSLADDARSTIEIADDGRGGADPAPAPACAGWPTGSPRSTARSTVESPAGGGTIVRGVIPCAS